MVFEHSIVLCFSSDNLHCQHRKKRNKTSYLPSIHSLDSFTNMTVFRTISNTTYLLLIVVSRVSHLGHEQESVLRARHKSSSAREKSRASKKKSRQQKNVAPEKKVAPVKKKSRQQKKVAPAKKSRASKKKSRTSKKSRASKKKVAPNVRKCSQE